MKKPNVILIYADDLGRGMLSCYGQKYFQTQNIDRLAREGAIFYRAYGCHMCAPARASLLAGRHDCHAGNWSFTKAGIYIDYAKGKRSLSEVEELIQNTGITEQGSGLFLPGIFRKAGYHTGQIGKLEWGFSVTKQELEDHGWDYHYGYYDHEMCHGYYPPFLFENGKRIDIEGNTDPHCGKGYSYGHEKYQSYRKDRSDKKQYSQDLFDEKILEYLERHRKEPFFLYHPSQLPHLALSVPEIDQQVKDNTNLNESEKEYASMVLRLDKTVGRIMKKLDELGLSENTLLLFTADNGHCFYYGDERNGVGLHHTRDGRVVDHLHIRYTSENCGDIFDGNNGFTGCKLSNFEGGTRVPLLVRWPQKIRPFHTEKLVSNYDIFATMAELVGIVPDGQRDSASYLPLLLGEEDRFQEHDYVIFAGENGPAIVTKDGWKLRSYLHPDFGYGAFGAEWEQVREKVSFELYDLKSDEREEKNLIDQYPQLAVRLQKILIKECNGNLIHGTTQPHFAFYANAFFSEKR